MSASRETVQSVERALDLIEALAGKELGVTQLAERTGLVPSTVHRLLATLVARGYVSKTTGSGRYQLGFKLLQLANDRDHTLSRLRKTVRPALESLQQATGETSNLVALDGTRVIYIDQVEGRHQVRMFTVVGESALAHTTASGKAIFAYGEPETVTSLYGEGHPMERLTPRTLTTVEELQEDLERIRRRGYSIDNEEHEEGVSCVAAPVFDATGQAVAAISVSAPTARILHAETSELGALLRRHASRISAELGHVVEEESEPAPTDAAALEPSA